VTYEFVKFTEVEPGGWLKSARRNWLWPVPVMAERVAESLKLPLALKLKKSLAV